MERGRPRTGPRLIAPSASKRLEVPAWKLGEILSPDDEGRAGGTIPEEREEALSPEEEERPSPEEEARAGSLSPDEGGLPIILEESLSSEEGGGCDVTTACDVNMLGEGPLEGVTPCGVGHQPMGLGHAIPHGCIQGGMQEFAKLFQDEPPVACIGLESPQGLASCALIGFKPEN